MEVCDFEIMSPAGSYESLMAAIQGGADSVYFGVGLLNMRAKSAYNFKIDDLHEIASICRDNGVKSYLTVNTIMYDEDIDQMRRIIDAAKENELDAVIASDVSVLQYAHSIEMPLHLSTQLNISNIEALEFFSQYADAAVLARELNLEQVAYIYREITRRNITGPSGHLVRIEMFAHGALCMAVSGKCYLSLHEMNSSANRGACNQVCRRAYTVHDKDSDIEIDIDNEYIMSPKDLKTIHFLNKMMDAGVRIFKIEGRARSADYVRIVTECYKQAVQACCDGSYCQEKIEEWDKRLAMVFNRGFWNGYYLGQRLGEWNHRYGSNATRQKIYIGKAVKYFGNLGVTEFVVEAQPISEGDELLITGPTTGALFLTALDIRVDLTTVPEAIKGEHFSIKTSEKVRPNDKLYKLVPAKRENLLI